MGSLGGGVFLQVAEEHEGGLRRPHREVCVLRLEDRGARGPGPGVADVSEEDLDNEGSGGCSFAWVVGRPAET